MRGLNQSHCAATKHFKWNRVCKSVKKQKVMATKSSLSTAIRQAQADSRTRGMHSDLILHWHI
jgi:hypothetical protein